MNIHFDDYEDGGVMAIRCKRSPSPVYVKDDNIRTLLRPHRPLYNRIDAKPGSKLH